MDYPMTIQNLFSRATLHSQLQPGNRRVIRVKLADQVDNTDPLRFMKLNRFTHNALRKRHAGVKERLLQDLGQ